MAASAGRALPLRQAVLQRVASGVRHANSGSAAPACLRQQQWWCRIPQQQRHQQQQQRRGAWLLARARGNRMLQELLEQQEEEEAEATPALTQLEWQSPLAVLPYPDPRLRAPNARIGVFDESLKRLAAEMFEVMYDDDGVGLAAPQVGVNVRLMVFNEMGEPGKGQEIVLVNPRVISSSGGPDAFEEGCLSFPSIYADVLRPTRVKVRAQDMSGKKFSLSLAGFPARIFQHEYDHLQGALFHDRMAPDVLSTIREDLVALEESFIKANPEAAGSVRRVA